MTDRQITEEATHLTSPAHRPGGFARWVAANIGTAVPLSMAPITFGLAALARGDLHGGALMMTAMTVAQVVGAVPIAAVGRRFSVSGYARVLAAYRTLAFAGLLLALAGRAPLPVLVGGAVLAGIVDGAIFALLRTILNDLVASSKLPRALGIVATVNELVFVTGPILASTLGGVSVVASVGVMAFASALPIVVLPRIARRTLAVGPARVREGLLRPRLVVWLVTAGSAAACVASVEVGAVALALRHSLAPTAAFFFTVPLCVGSVLGGVWVSVRNRRPGQRTVVAMILLTVVGTLAVGSNAWLATTIAGAVLIGLCLAPLGTAFSLFIDDVLPAPRRAEGFALLRTSKSLGLILASSVIALASLEAALITAAALTLLSAILVAIQARTGRRD